MITCTKCLLSKNENDFYRRKNRNSFLNVCKACFSEYQGKKLLDRKIRAIDYKSNECKDCHLKYDGFNHYIFDFHHLNPVEKEMDWRIMRLQTWECCMTELDKCELLCANCHRIRHADLRNIGKTLTPLFFTDKIKLGKPLCQECANPVSERHILLCKSCFLAKRKKEDWPTTEKLTELVQSMPMTKVGKLLDRSDVAVKRQCRIRNISLPPKGHWLKK